MQPITEQIPIRIDEDGRMRLGNTRVLLNLVVYSFWQGEAPETIVNHYSSLSLADVYLAIGYYLRHREEIDAHIQREDEEAKQLQQKIEAQYTPQMRDARERYKAWAVTRRDADDARLKAEIEKQKSEAK